MTASKHMIGGTHYTDMPIQPWDVIDTWPIEQRIGFYRGTALAYVMRAGSKGDAAEDIAKAHHVLAKLAEVMGFDTQRGTEAKDRHDKQGNK